MRILELLESLIEVTVTFVNHHGAEHAVSVTVLWLLCLFWHVHEVVSIHRESIVFVSIGVCSLRTDFPSLERVWILSIIEIILASLFTQAETTLISINWLWALSWLRLERPLGRNSSSSILLCFTYFFYHIVLYVLADLFHLIWERCATWDGWIAWSWLHSLVLFLEHGLHYSVQMEIYQLLIRWQKLISCTSIDELKSI